MELEVIELELPGVEVESVKLDTRFVKLMTKLAVLMAEVEVGVEVTFSDTAVVFKVMVMSSKPTTHSFAANASTPPNPRRRVSDAFFGTYGKALLSQPLVTF